MNYKTLNESDFALKHPFNAVVYGASGSGKTEWVMNLLKNVETMIHPQIESILYCYGVFDARILEMHFPALETFEGLPSEEMLRQKPKPLLLILDDLLLEADSSFLTRLFTRDTHHKNISVVFLTQNLFDKAVKVARTNAHYIVLMRNPAGELQVRNLGIHLFPRNLKFFLSAYDDATRRSFGYLFIDLHPKSPDTILRLRTDIFNTRPIIYKNATSS